MTAELGFGLHFGDQRRRDRLAVIGQARGVTIEDELGVEIGDGRGAADKAQAGDELRGFGVASGIERRKQNVALEFEAEAMRGDGANLDEDAAGEPGELGERIGNEETTPRQEDDFGLGITQELEPKRLGVVGTGTGRGIARNGEPVFEAFRVGQFSPRSAQSLAALISDGRYFGVTMAG
jgi:hypothetical protein